MQYKGIPVTSTHDVESSKPQHKKKIVTVGVGGVAVVVVVVMTVMLMINNTDKWSQKLTTVGEAGGCHHPNSLGVCDMDQGPPHPSHLQPVYLGSDWGPGWWWYATADGWVTSYQNDIRSITDTENSWAKWIWHDCGNGTVCLESAKYPCYYLYTTKDGHLAVSYSSAPEAEDWTRLINTTERNESRGLYMVLISERFHKHGYRKGLSAYIYVPSRCEGYRKVVDYINKSPEIIDYTYTYEQGIAKAEKDSKSHTKAISVEAKIEVIAGIVSLSTTGSFSTTWVNEQTKALSDKHTHESNINILPGKRLIIWQKVATYGQYEWRSSSSFITCAE